ncbi:MAG: OsmC family protein [Chlamydiales bacterium]|nr:OsmC family protein [Chlamydiales bacterium]
MVKAIVKYQGDLICNVEHGPSGSKILTDAPVDNMGKGSQFSPTDLVAAALGSCIATTIAILAKRKGWDVEGMHLEVEKIMSDDSPRRIRSLPVLVWMPQRLDTEKQAMVEKAAMTCPVHKSLHPDIESTIVFNWPD